jgi:hypothetical protein
MGQFRKILSTTSSAMANDAVAAGLGALITCSERGF